ncbi:tyrosine-protein phosphatase YVH1 isoform X2 [Copidosoma floridanum]|uniref:tyrosine-protein phosphatase YVH1 isoform X2 n=1 Tax=Copidosoma floridanum TaxID=29053 RepID=UPI0006C9670B|nr:tyrosine-protein phosphatase YVH1 isoform X2 [Copidosoma floridanum]
MPAKITQIKCKRCRSLLFTEEASPPLDSHGQLIKAGERSTKCNSDVPEECLFLAEENMPDWVQEVVDRENWIKGKLYCPLCHARIGSFDFVSTKKCNCGEYVPPPIRITYSKVDSPHR